MLRDLWPQIEPAENPIDYVTNGVHVLTFLAPEWYDIFDRFLGVDWPQRLTDREYWERVERIPDAMFWSVREYLKSQMLQLVRHRVHTQLAAQSRQRIAPRPAVPLRRPGQPNVLTIGFGRRFATYKRSTLLFTDLDVLREIVLQPGAAGAVHLRRQGAPGRRARAGPDPPHHAGGEDAGVRRPHPARRGLRPAPRAPAASPGVDVWLNNPIHPLEASGTSGMKAAMNGAINLSVLDGWWDEGYDGDQRLGDQAGLRPHRPGRARSGRSAHALRDPAGSRAAAVLRARRPRRTRPDGCKMAKRAMATILPRFNAERMLNEYVDQVLRARGAARAPVPGRRLRGGGRRSRAGRSACARRGRRCRFGGSARPAQRIRFGERVRIEARRRAQRPRPRRTSSSSWCWSARTAATTASAQRIPLTPDGSRAGRRLGALRARPRPGALRQARLPHPRVPEPPAAHAPLRAGADARRSGSSQARGRRWGRMEAATGNRATSLPPSGRPWALAR